MNPLIPHSHKLAYLLRSMAEDKVFRAVKLDYHFNTHLYLRTNTILRVCNKVGDMVWGQFTYKMSKGWGWRMIENL